MKENARLQNALYNLGAGLQNLAADLPGERPRFVVIELTGRYPARALQRKLPELLTPRTDSLEEFETKLAALAQAEWLEGVVFRLGELQVNLATAYALRRAIARLSEQKTTWAFGTSFDMRSYYVASAAREIVAPESAEWNVLGLALSQTYLRDALERYGIRFEKIAVREYKTAMDTLTESQMTPYQREQLEALLRSLDRTFCQEVAASRNTTPETVHGWLEAGVTSSAQARELGLIDRIGYEDVLLDKQHHPLAQAARFLKLPLRDAAARRVAVVSLEGNIIVGKSRRSPLPLPLFGGAQAGSETLVRALRRAERDESTAAVVLYVDSGGGSALASDLIWREVARIRVRKPVVAVMGALAASGGYYVLTHAHKVIAAPGTLTGSIGVILGKAILEEFDRKYGFNREILKSAPFADITASSAPFSPQERALLERMATEVYERFTARVAEGRGLSRQRVDEIGRGRVWSGADALELGLVDEIGDLEVGIARARELAGLPANAPTWNVEAPRTLVLPDTSEPQAVLNYLAPLLRERALLMMPGDLQVY